MLEAPIRKVEEIENNSIIRGRRRPKKILGETIMTNLINNNLTIEMSKGKTRSYRLIHIANTP